MPAFLDRSNRQMIDVRSTQGFLPKARRERSFIDKNKINDPLHDEKTHQLVGPIQNRLQNKKN